MRFRTSAVSTCSPASSACICSPARNAASAVVEPAAAHLQQALRDAQNQLRPGLSGVEGVLRPLQPALGLRETPEPHQQLAAYGEGRSGDRVGGPAVGLGDRDRLLAALKRDGGGQSSEQGGHGQWARLPTSR